MHHAVVDAWIEGKSLVTCPLSELAFLRISTHPKAFAARMDEARKLLEDFIAKHEMEFVAADLPALQSRAKQSGEVTDYYLADLAVRKNLRLATLDRTIAHGAVEIIS